MDCQNKKLVLLGVTKNESAKKTDRKTSLTQRNGGREDFDNQLTTTTYKNISFKMMMRKVELTIRKITLIVYPFLLIGHPI